MRRPLALAAAAAMVAGAAACSAKATPPAADAKLCGVTMASWWFDATGADKLVGSVDGEKLPLTNPTPGRVSFARSECRVFSDGKEVGNFTAELTTDIKVRSAATSIAGYPAGNRFSVAGGDGGVRPPGAGDDNTVAGWTCGSNLLQLKLLRVNDEKKRVELTKTLAERVAGVAGCPPAQATS
jgi:hypothetical protein